MEQLPNQPIQEFFSDKEPDPKTPTACTCMSCMTGLPGNKRSFGNEHCLTNTHVISKLIETKKPLFIKEQLGKYADESPFMTMKKSPQEKQADCDCISCFINEKCLIWGYEPGEITFTQKQLGQYYRYSPLYKFYKGFD